MKRLPGLRWRERTASEASAASADPDVRLRWRDVMTGAVVTAVLFTIGQQVIGLYLGQSAIASMYGAAGSMMILLLWVYYSCQILLFGAQFTRVWRAARCESEARGVCGEGSGGGAAEVGVDGCQVAPTRSSLA